MTVALLLIIILISTTIVRVAAFALELTGIPWEQAKFQALSAFSTTGFATRESEQIMAHPMRRRIVSTLIVLGNAGIVTAIGTFAGTVSAEEPLDLAMNAGILLVGLVVVIGLARSEAIAGRLRRRVRAWMEKRYDFQQPQADELLRLDEGYGLTRIEIDRTSPVHGRSLADLKLNTWRVQVLAIERDGAYHPVPSGTDRLLAGDHVVVYGATQGIAKVFQPRTSTRLTIIGEGGLAVAPASSAQASTKNAHASTANAHAGTVHAAMGPTMLAPGVPAGGVPGSGVSTSGAPMSADVPTAAFETPPPPHASPPGMPASFPSRASAPTADPPTQALVVPSPPQEDAAPSKRGRYVPVQGD